jgi:hypothetical protein
MNQCPHLRECLGFIACMSVSVNGLRAIVVRALLRPALTATLTLMTSMVRAQQRTKLMVARRHSRLANITTIPAPNTTMTAPTNKNESDAWHPRYRADKQLIHFISKDGKRFAFDKEILRKER